MQCASSITTRALLYVNDTYGKEDEKLPSFPLLLSFPSADIKVLFLSNISGYEFKFVESL